MRVDMPFGRELLALEVPEYATILRPNPTASMLGPIEAVREALRNPIAGPPLTERVRPGDDVAIVVSDITRPVPNQVLLGPILAEPPIHTTRIVRPPEMTSRLAHWIASSSGWRNGKLARQTSPSFSRLVRAART